MRPLDRLQAEEEIEAAGIWAAARVTVCSICERYKVTDAERVCRRCALEIVQSLDEEAVMEAGFEMEEAA